MVQDNIHCNLYIHEIAINAFLRRLTYHKYICVYILITFAYQDISRFNSEIDKR